MNEGSVLQEREMLPRLLDGVVNGQPFARGVAREGKAAFGRDLDREVEFPETGTLGVLDFGRGDAPGVGKAEAGREKIDEFHRLRKG